MSDIQNQWDNVPRRGPFLGIDLGSKTLGLALSDGGLRVASPLGLHKSRKFSLDAKELAVAIDHHQVTAMVLGMPLRMDGSWGARAQSTKGFAHNLRAKAGIKIPIFFWDERMTTAEVERMLIKEMDMTRKRRANVIDKLAATVILQNFLDAYNTARHKQKNDSEQVVS